MISIEDKKDAVEGYVQYSTLTSEELDRFYSDLSFTDLCNVRDLLAEIDLSEEEQLQVDRADQCLSNAFQPETLTKYAGYYPELPIRDWWG